MLYLTIGVIGVIGNSCMQVSYGGELEFVFINETDHTIEFCIWADIEDDTSAPYSEWPRTVKILPNSTSKVFAIETVGGSKGISPDLHQKTIENLICSFDEKFSILVDSVECFWFENTGFALASNYENEVLGDRRVRYTYTFTNADFEIGKPCEE